MVIETKYGKICLKVKGGGSVSYKEYGYPVDELTRNLEATDKQQELHFFVCDLNKNGEVFYPGSGSTFIINRKKYTRLEGTLSIRDGKPHIYCKASGVTKDGRTDYNSFLTDSAREKLQQDLLPVLAPALQEMEIMKQELKERTIQRSIENFEKQIEEIQKQLDAIKNM